MATEQVLERPTQDQPPRRRHLIAAGVAGLVAVGAGLAVGELGAVLAGPDASPYFAVGSSVVDHTPTVVREWAITTFGTSDKTALFTGMGVIIAVLASVCGVLERRFPLVGSVIIAVFGLVGVIAALARPDASWTAALPSVATAVVAVVVLRWLVGLLPKVARDLDTVPPLRSGSYSISGAAVSRRFILSAAGIAVAAAGVGVVARRLVADAARTVADRASLVLPRPASPAAPLPAGVDLPGAIPFVSSNADFYRIDTALQVPNVTTADWSLRIHGMVDNELTISWDELLAMPMVERYTTLTCVSNEIGGDLIGNARWLGVPMKALLDRAGVKPGSTMLLSTSVDGWTCGTPVSAVTDGRDALLAVGMNGQPLPVEHGFPVRQVVPGLYGYVSATKWVSDWELTTFENAQGYWTTRGWSALGPIKLASRIDRPSSNSTLRAGEVIVAGTAWAQHTGVRSVEVRIDNGPWQPAQLATEYSVDTWRQWRYSWAATPGTHTVTCRAIDNKGTPQIEAIADPIPDGATGLDSRTYQVT